MNLKVILIDDENRALNLLKAMLHINFPNIEILAMCNNLELGVKAIKKMKPDLVFLDIEMPGNSGLEILNYFDENEVNFEIVFITAYSEYAVEAFKLSAADYLLKPISDDILVKTVNKIILKNERIQSKKIYNALKENLDLNVGKKIAITVGHSVKLIDLKNLVLMKADRSYTEVILDTDQMYIVSKNLGHFEEVLEPLHNFIRINKSNIVNLDFITEISKSDGGFITLNHKHEISISLEKRDFIMKLIDQKIYKI